MQVSFPLYLLVKTHGCMCRILSHVASENYNANMTNTVSTKAVASMLLLLAKLPYVVLLNILLPIMHALDNLLRRFALQILKRGPIPKHIAIIMDGNRRYARKAGIAKKEAHTLGFQALKDVSSNLIGFLLIHYYRA